MQKRLEVEGEGDEINVDDLKKHMDNLYMMVLTCCQNHHLENPPYVMQ